MHSAPGRQVGWDEVRAAWQQFANLTSGGRARTSRDARLVLLGAEIEIDRAVVISRDFVEAVDRGQELGGFRHLDC